MLFPPVLRPGHSKRGYYILEGFNSFATAYYFNYLLFLLRDSYGFSDLNNLTIGALHGLIYIPASLVGGRFGQRHGNFVSLRIGFGGMALGVAIGWWVPSLWGQLLALVVWTITLCFTWPILEALVSQHEPPDRLPDRVGLYNVVWAGTAALGYSSGGWLFERLGPASLYWLPLTIHLGQFLATWPLAKRHHAWEATMPILEPDARRPDSTARSACFQRLAWLANPFNYMAINTAVAMAPGLSSRAGLGLTEAGLVFSVWFYARTLAFLKLWLWPGWHYHFGWFMGSLVVLLLSFASIVLAGSVPVLVVAQLGFGWASAVLYYSSLYYAMDGSQTHSEQGGIHEALIGVGICGGPALSSLAQFLTGNQNAPTWAVSGALVAAIALVWRVHRQSARPARQ